jgi:hypothetical protein
MVKLEAACPPGVCQMTKPDRGADQAYVHQYAVPWVQAKAGIPLCRRRGCTREAPAIQKCPAPPPRLAAMYRTTCPPAGKKNLSAWLEHRYNQQHIAQHVLLFERSGQAVFGKGQRHGAHDRQASHMCF